MYGSIAEGDAAPPVVLHLPSQEQAPASHIQTTKLRVQNICCGKEADLIKEELRDVEGVKKVYVNIVGRMAHISHDSSVIQAADIAERLNRLHLGISVLETGHKSSEESDKQRFRLYLRVFGVALLTLLFSVQVVAVAKKFSWEKWIAIPLCILGGLPILWKALLYIRRLVFANIPLLMLMAMSGAIVLQKWLDAAMIVYFFTIADVMEQYCRYKVQKNLGDLMLKSPETAVLAEDNRTVPIEQVPLGTLIVVCAGERIPLDGEVTKGSAAVDESSITGESSPVSKSVGSSVFGGTIIQSGYLKIVTTCDAKSSTISRVQQMVEEAQAKASRMEEMLNRFAKFYTPVVLLTSLLVFLIPYVVYSASKHYDQEAVRAWGTRAIIVLVVACPCALIMATPIPMVCGITRAAQLGILIKGGVWLESVASVDVVAFDKTGTLTEGHFRVLNEKAVDYSRNDALRYAATLEAKSSHPLAACIINHYSGCVTDKLAEFGLNVGLPDVSQFKNEGGMGLSGVIEGHRVCVGNLELVRSLNALVDEETMDCWRAWSGDGQTVVFVLVDNQVALVLGMADKCRPTAARCVAALADMNIETVMITGDNAGSAEVMRRKVGIRQCEASMKPSDKLSWIQQKQGAGKGRKVLAMVGDGVNDSPSLAAADVGIAIGASATALAVQSAGISLMADNLMKIPSLIAFSRRCKRVVVQSIAGSLTIKGAFVVAALAGKTMLWLAVLSDVIGLLFVVLNGVRPLYWRDTSEDAVVQVSISKSRQSDGDVMEGDEGQRLITVRSFYTENV